jgi:signal transduction histidine kinase
MGLSHQIKQGNIRVSVGKLPTIHTDPVAMGQIMSNLLTNAILYLDPTRPGEVEISAETAEESITFHVRDNGRGIAEADRSKIFEPFRRAGKEDGPGHGMGLANVQMLVRRLGGRVWYTSTFGVGTTFSFTISTISQPVAVLQPNN